MTDVLYCKEPYVFWNTYSTWWKHNMYKYVNIKEKNGDSWQQKTLTVFWEGTQRLSNGNIKFIVLKSGHKQQKDFETNDWLRDGQL